MRLTKRRAVVGLIGVVSLTAGAVAAYAGTKTWDFNSAASSSDLTIGGNGVSPGELQETGGKTGGFLALTWPIGSQVSMVRFPNIDPGKVVTAFKFEADLRVGNSTGDRAADGFSVSFAREGDLAITDETISTGNQGVFAGGIAEGGSTTGIAVSFDTWSGNTLPDGADIEGIIVRVDNVTVNRTALPTRHGACDDATSLQTGPRTPDLWAASADPTDPATYTGLCWQPLLIDLDTTAKLTVSWKGRKVLDAFQTSFFPTAGQIVLAGRTGGANEHTHFDNIKLTTVAEDAGATPSAPGNFRSAQTGARRIALAWDAATIPGNPNGRVGYELTRDGATLNAALSGTTYEVTGLDPGKTYNFTLKAKNVAGVASAAVNLSVTTVAEVDNLGFLHARVYRTDSSGAIFGGAGQDGIDTVLGDAKWPNSPDNTYYIQGLSFGEPNFGDTYGENHMVAISTVLTAPESGQFRFFVRSDDASRLYINKTGAAIPNPTSDTPVAQENGCCGAFEEVGAADNGDGTFPTSEPIALTAGSKYGILFLVKEGGGGDWGQVAMRKEGSTVAASALQPIGGAYVTGKGDAVGAVVEFTSQPASVTVTANQSVTLSAGVNASTPYGKAPFYQWYKGASPIAGATSASYTIPVVAAADGGEYSLEVGVVGLAKKSNPAVLTVNADTKAPLITGSEGFGNVVNVTFDEPVKANTATVTVSGGLTVSGVVQNGEKGISAKLSGDLTPESSYTVSVSGLQDNAGNAIAAGSSSTFTSWKFVAGSARVRYFDNLSPSSLGNLQVVRNTTAPSLDYSTNLFGAFTDRAENFGTILSGWIKPPTTGDYAFYISADDNAQLWLSTDENPANVKRIAIEPQWNGARDWVGTARRNADAPENRSDKYAATQWPTGNKITLTAGNRYYIEMIAQEGGGGDNSAIAVTPAGTEATADTLPITGSWIHGYFLPPAGGGSTPTVTLARDGAGIKITYTGTLESADSVNGPWAPVAGATSPATIATSGAGKFYRARQ